MQPTIHAMGGRWRASNDSSEVRELLLGRGLRDGGGRPSSNEPRSSMRSELLPRDTHRGSIGWALSAQTQRLRSTHEPSSPNGRQAALPADTTVDKLLAPVPLMRRSRSADLDRTVGVSPGPKGNGYCNGDRASSSRASPRPEHDRALTSHGSPRPEGSDCSPRPQSDNDGYRANGCRTNGYQTRSPRLEASQSIARIPTPLNSNRSRRSSQPSQEAEYNITNRFELDNEAIMVHQGGCRTSSPTKDGQRWAGKPLQYVSPNMPPQRESTPDVRASDYAPRPADCDMPSLLDSPKGRRVIIDKNAPSDHWMAAPSSNIRREIKYQWEQGQPELQWRRHVPSAIPVSAMKIFKEKRMADPQGRPGLRQFSKIQKNASSDPYALQPEKNRSPPKALQDRLDKGKRLYGRVAKNVEYVSLSPRSLSPRSPDTAGVDSRQLSRRLHTDWSAWTEATTSQSVRSTRRQYSEKHSNRPSEVAYSPTGAAVPGTLYWDQRTLHPVSPSKTPRSTRSISMDPDSPGERQSASLRRSANVPGDRGVSPITGKRSSHHQQLGSGWRK